MFDAPDSTLYKSLNNLLERPKEYLADVCFCFESIEMWAHRGILLVRASKEFISKYMPEIQEEVENTGGIRIDMKAVKISVQQFRALLRFWYTASYYPKDKDILDKVGIKLGTLVLPLDDSSDNGSLVVKLDTVQLVNDLKEMRNDKISADVSISLVSSHDTQKTLAKFKAHRFILAAQSPYFYALFCTQFQESHKQEIHFADDLFNEAIIDTMLTFFYTDKVIVAPLAYDTNKPFSAVQRKLLHQKHVLRVIQKAFYAADYLGHGDNLGKALLCEMEKVCHLFKCVCPECAALLPSMLAWSDKHVVDVVPKLKRTLILLYSDPVHAMPSLWCQRPFSLLVTSFVPFTEELGYETKKAVLKGDPLFRARTPKTLIHEIVERSFYNITKHNAVHVLHSLHLCLSHIRSADPHPSWSRPTLDLVKPILDFTVDNVCQSLDFYCGEYPILLSCVDGIGAGFSIDFLDFLLRHVLHQGIQITNAGIIYQVIVRDLGGRQEVVKNMAIDDVLVKARQRCAAYISKHWTSIKAKGGFTALDKATLRQLADDINIPYRNLVKPYETEFSNIFSFKKSKKIASVVPDDKNEYLTQVYTRRLSLGNLITRGSSTNNGSRTFRSRPRALSSTEAVSSLARYHPPPPRALENQPFINLLSAETDERRRVLEEGENTTTTPQPTISTPSTIESRRPVLRTSSSFTSLTDQLLPIEGTVISSSTVSSSSSTSSSSSNNDHTTTTPRPTRLKFELPTTPARSKSPNLPYLVQMPSLEASSTYLSPGVKNRHHRRGSKSRIAVGRWSMGSSDVSDDEETALPALGNKIELLRRPLPTMGTIKYIGPVRFAEGTYIGVELESRLGKSDGSVDGIRYFFTDPQRALFVKPDDFKIILD
ncbi:hypothetical protein HPULCUR_004712 [Helicostylum pulchrum]|uniref:Uncharacterized protein n=1 Tax=Helicostylum pulchrum TaxID=562976 RepID=A0ABP9XX68_9FUNG